MYDPFERGGNGRKENRKKKNMDDNVFSFI